MNDVIRTLGAAQKFMSDNPELHAEYSRRRAAGEWFKPGEPVTAYMQELTRLDLIASRAACGY